MDIECQYGVVWAIDYVFSGPASWQCLLDGLNWLYTIKENSSIRKKSEHDLLSDFVVG